MEADPRRRSRRSHEAEWQEEFELYRQIPQYQQINKGMSLDEFKTIFWWEWAHRLLARGVGIVFALPLCLLLATGRIERGLKAKAGRTVGARRAARRASAGGWWRRASPSAPMSASTGWRSHLTLACIIFASDHGGGAGLAPH
jgi:cytochrome c oxidase assembly protein subunit 15